MNPIAQRVPYEPDPTAKPYHAAHDHARLKGSKLPARFAKWYVENGTSKAVADAWAAAPEEVKAT